MQLRPTPGLPDPGLQPPTVATAGDPFAELRVVHLLARVPRGTSLRVRDLVDQLNRDYLDWSFSRAVVLAAVVQLQANWQSDYRNSDGIVLRDGDVGPEMLIEQPRGPLDRAPGRTPPRRVPGAAARVRHRGGRRALSDTPVSRVPRRSLRALRWRHRSAHPRRWSGRRRQGPAPGRSRDAIRTCLRA